MSLPLISVIIPIYKVEDYLRECVDSVLGQTYRNLEVILVDDGSPDNCGTICDEYAAVDPRIKVIHKENGGLSDARNAGLDIAIGEYISFIDSDDFVHPSFIETLYKNMIKYNADISFCGITSGLFSIKENSRKFDFNYFYFTLKAMTQKVVVWNKLYKKKIWENLRFDKGKYHEDEFIFHKLYYNRTFSYTTSELYYYRQREGSIMTSSSVGRIYDSIEAYTQRYRFFQKNAKKYCCRNLEQLIYLHTIAFNMNSNSTSKKFLRGNISKILSAETLNIKEKLMLIYNLYTK